MTSNFKNEVSLLDRRKESNKILHKYPDRVPIICDTTDKTHPLDKNKFLVPCDFTVSQFVSIIRKRLKVDQNTGIFLYVNDNTLPPANELMCKIYNEYKDDDGFLYIRYNSESTFG